MPFVKDGLADSAQLLGAEADTILLGRVTYQGFSRYWPSQPGAAFPETRARADQRERGPEDLVTLEVAVQKAQNS